MEPIVRHLIFISLTTYNDYSLSTSLPNPWKPLFTQDYHHHLQYVVFTAMLPISTIVIFDVAIMSIIIIMSSFLGTPKEKFLEFTPREGTDYKESMIPKITHCMGCHSTRVQRLPHATMHRWTSASTIQGGWIKLLSKVSKSDWLRFIVLNTKYWIQYRVTICNKQ